MTDTNGNILHIQVHAANIHDTIAGVPMLKTTFEKYPISSFYPRNYAINTAMPGRNGGQAPSKRCDKTKRWPQEYPVTTFLKKKKYMIR